MKHRIGIIFAACVFSGLCLAKYAHEHVPPMTPEQTRAEFARLITDMDGIAMRPETLFSTALQQTGRFITLTTDAADVSAVLENRNSETGTDMAVETPENSDAKTELENKTIALLARFESLDTDALATCERYNYHVRTGHLQSQLWHLNVPSSAARVRDIEAYVYRLTGTPHTLDDIAALAEAEMSDIETALRHLETQVIKSGAATDLEEFAALPHFFRTDPAVIQSEYQSLLSMAAEQLGGELHGYNAPQAGSNVLKRAHRWNAVASYSKNQMVLYFSEDTYDTKLYRLLAAHEITPGHHISEYARRQGNICGGQRQRGTNLLEEGWATYAEYIAARAGFFDPPEQRLGWLDYRSIRAMRIIMDVHGAQEGWDVEPLKALWEARLPPRLHPVFMREYERLQRSGHHHLGYIFGRRAIENARAEIAFEMGHDFDPKYFHDAVLRARYQHMSTFTEQVRALMDAGKALDFGADISVTAG